MLLLQFVVSLTFISFNSNVLQPRLLDISVNSKVLQPRPLDIETTLLLRPPIFSS